ncbi:MAG: glycosyltransferase family 39 protein [Candidatus Aenigmarchaeota archaeon]|nr:glycosyltransferase family 39 protein [Candidatus Aenigmarchaeota archaeon]
MHFTSKNYEKCFFIICLVLAALLLFYNLGDRFIGPTDEAYVVERSQEIIKIGYPGDLQVSLVTLPHLYLTSLSVLVFGLNQFSIRFVSAVFGILFLVLYFVFLKENVKDRKTRIIAFLLVIFSTLFYLHARHGRYYSMLMFFSLLTIFFFIRFMKNRKNSMLPFIISSVILFYTHAEVGIYLIAGLFLFSIIERRNNIKNIFSPFILIGIFSLPLIILWLYSRQTLSPLSSVFNTGFLLLNIASGVFYLLVFFLPPAIVVLGLYLVKKNKINWRKLSTEHRLFLTIIITILVLSSLISVTGPISIRKLIVLLPLASILIAYVISQMFFARKNNAMKFLGFIILIILVFTNFINIIPLNFIRNVDLGSYATQEVTDRFLSRSLQPRYYFFDYLYEATHHYEYSSESVIKVVSQTYVKGDKIFLMSNYVPPQAFVMYLNASQENIISRNNLSELNESYRWIIIDNATTSPNANLDLYINTAKYEIFTVHNTGEQWSEFPDPVHHRFSPEQNGYILIYKKI